MPPAISIRNLGKRYCVNHAVERAPYRTLRDSLARAASVPLRRPRRETNGASEEFWALKDVEFDVAPGEVVGIIGRNGAGKSTLLKILSRITSPTTGEVTINGRIGSLLEVGTGFHPELTGRENIYMNGSILGMSRREISRKFDEIVDFAEIERFLDTPVKRYSSGMYVRLAFAVAAHLNPDVLLIDEVLAVGDAAFQRKCLGKVADAARSGRTAIFVSHNMAPVLYLCKQAWLLDGGKVVFSGGAGAVVAEYLRTAEATGTVALGKRIDRAGEGFARILSLAISNSSDASRSAIRCGDGLRVELAYECARTLHGATFMVGIYGPLNQSLFRLDSEAAGGLTADLSGRGRLRCVTAPLNVVPGRYSVNVAIMMRSTIIDHIPNAASFTVEEEDFYETGNLPPAREVPCLLRQRWTLHTY